MMDIDKTALEKALRRAFSLGQECWRLADSMSYSDNRKSADTRRKFEALVAELCTDPKED